MYFFYNHMAIWNYQIQLIIFKFHNQIQIPNSEFKKQLFVRFFEHTKEHTQIEKKFNKILLQLE